MILLLEEWEDPINLTCIHLRMGLHYLSFQQSPAFNLGFQLVFLALAHVHIHKQYLKNAL